MIFEILDSRSGLMGGALIPRQRAVSVDPCSYLLY